MAKTKTSLNDLIEQSIKNVESDRSTAEMLLTDLVIFMKKTGDSSHSTSGDTAAKYLETLQRSNEQLVKLAGIVQKNEGTNERNISEAEKAEMFDIIRGK